MKANIQNVHISGSSELVTDKLVINFIKDKLRDIAVKKESKEIILTFKDLNEMPETITDLPGFQLTLQNQNQIIFKEVEKEVINKDTVTLLKTVKNLLKKHKTVTMTPSEYYNEFMSAILSVGITYSSFVEMLFANTFISDYKNKEFWRYNQTESIDVKLGDKGISKYISDLLGLLYEPNKNSIKNLTREFNDLKFDPKKMTIYEKIWFGEL